MRRREAKCSFFPSNVPTVASIPDNVPSKHDEELYTPLSQPLTIKPAMSLGKSSQKELAVLFHRFEEVPLALESQRLLHLTGAAGVVLRTEPQVLAWKTKGETRPEERERLGLITYYGGQIRLFWFNHNITYNHICLLFFLTHFDFAFLAKRCTSNSY